MIELTRRYGFPAAHVLRHDSLSEDENQRLYGRCANPGGHGHNYGVEVTVAGPVDPRSGEVMDRGRLDALVEERVIARFGHRLLNAHEDFESLVPTAENLALVIYRGLADAVAASGAARLRRVRVRETRKNSFEYGEA